jgi:hypothetical protein
MTLYALEGIICRVRALDPDSEHFRSECWEISARIIRQPLDISGRVAKGRHAQLMQRLDRDAALPFMEALLIWDALLARREERAPSFPDIVQRLRASSEPGFAECRNAGCVEEYG